MIIDQCGPLNKIILLMEDPGGGMHGNPSGPMDYYAKQCRSKFGLHTNQCMIGEKRHHFSTDLVWHLYGNPMKTSDDLEIVGVAFSGNNKFDKHVQLRSQKCRRLRTALNSELFVCRYVKGTTLCAAPIKIYPFTILSYTPARTHTHMHI